VLISRPKKVGKKDNKKGGKKRHQRRWHKKQQESLFLNLSCCCLETGLVPIRNMNEVAVLKISCSSDVIS